MPFFIGWNSCIPNFPWMMDSIIHKYAEKLNGDAIYGYNIDVSYHEIAVQLYDTPCIVN